MDGDVYSDKPHLYSPALATWNQFRVGEKIQRDDTVPSVHDRVVEEGADGDGDDIRSAHGIPSDVKGRRKHFQYEENRKAFEWEAGRLYWADFGNPYLDFRSEFAFILSLSYFPGHANSIRFFTPTSRVQSSYS